jgi:hypothetical protein
MMVGFEFLVYVGVTYIGICFILTSEGVTNIVQSAVAITFINEISRMALFMFDTEADLVDTGRYRLRVGQRLECESACIDDRRFLCKLSAYPGILVTTAIAIIFVTFQASCV